MGSVIISWRGSCDSSEKRTGLLKKIKILADLNHGHSDGIEPIKLYSGAYTKNILLDAKLIEGFANSDHLIPLTGNGKLINAKKPEDVIQLQFYEVKKARLFGIEFRLFDPRGLYPDENRMSFVFCSIPGLKKGNNFFTLVEPGYECEYYSNEVIRAYDYYLTAPYVHLRYLFEDWVQMLLAYVKFFFIENLTYDTFSGKKTFREFRAEFKDGGSRDHWLNKLKNCFEKEINNWETDENSSF